MDREHVGTNHNLCNYPNGRPNGIVSMHFLLNDRCQNKHGQEVVGVDKSQPAAERSIDKKINEKGEQFIIALKEVNWFFPPVYTYLWYHNGLLATATVKERKRREREGKKHAFSWCSDVVYSVTKYMSQNRHINTYLWIRQDRASRRQCRAAFLASIISNRNRLNNIWNHQPETKIMRAKAN